MRVKLAVAYDGTEYHGWQLQPNAITIEEELNNCLSELLKEPIQVIGASRTDAGVHSLGNIAVFDTQTRMPAEKISYAMNQRLPSDIRIQSSEECPADFHPRHCNTRKTYQYRILSSEFENPLFTRFCHHTHNHYNIEAMKEAAKYFVGEHDFASFCATASSAQTTIREIYELSVASEPAGNGINNCAELITITVTGNGFLYNMVRIIAGTLMEVGVGRFAPTKMKEILDGKDRQLAGPTAPACGLLLYSYEFV